MILDYKVIGKNIKAARLLRGITQRELAEKINVSWETISRYESGLISPLKRIDAIALALEIPLTFLLTPPEELKNKLVVKDSLYLPKDSFVIPLIIEKNTVNKKGWYSRIKTAFIAPWWLRQFKELQLFAVLSSIVEFTNSKYENNGVLVLARKYIKVRESMCLYRVRVKRSTNLVLADCNKSNLPEDKDLLGRLVMFEMRFL